MNFDDYANHIYQKHRLAIALAIIRTKPPHLSTIQYIDEIKSKINDKMDDDDVTVCSDDFLINDDDEINDSVNLLNGVDPDMLICDENGVGNEMINELDGRDKQTDLLANLSEITYYNNAQSQNITPTPIITNEIRPDQNINKSFNTEQTVPSINNNVDFNIKQDNLNNKYLNNDKSTNLSTINKDFNTVTEPTKENTNNALDLTFYDSQQTIPYTVHGFTQNTHYSESQNNIFVPSKYLYNSGKNRSNENADMNSSGGKDTVKNIQDTNYVLNENQILDTGNTIPMNLNEINNQQQINEDVKCIQTINMFSQNTDDNFEIANITDNYNYCNIENTMNKNVNTIRNEDTTTVHTAGKLNITESSRKPTENTKLFIEEHDYFSTDIENNDFSRNLESIDMEIAQEYTQSIDIFSKNVNVNEKNDINKHTIDENYTQIDIEDTNFHTLDKNNTNIILEHNNDDYEIADDENDAEEVIPYKVLEEFNKVKMFLHRRDRRMSCDGYSTDSGYRSDSQRSNNRSALQLSGNWLDQSGCCLFNYIMQCHLVAATRDITHEIAQVLSDLIDRLHEEEKYPVFLEELLEAIDLLLQQVFEGVSSDDSEILKQDERIQRILLLAKSINIQKHTIDKITKILESFHSKITEKESAYELTNIIQIENVSYIFHLLEILLKKYLKSKQLSSQCSSQFSQNEEKVFKKSSITDIWRKKWNLSQKTFEGSEEKKCVLKCCSEVLNKIVIDCVASYSLVAYSAVKCFNTMQS